jgi:hypothetical protein
MLSLKGKSVGSFDKEHVRRVLFQTIWIAASDHYISGDCEIQLIRPAETDEAGYHDISCGIMEHIFVDIRSYPGVLETRFGDRFQKAVKGVTIPDKAYELLVSGSDSLTPRIYHGDYAELAKVLASIELRLPLMTDLLRSHDVNSMRTALAFAAADAFSNAVTDVFHSDVDAWVGSIQQRGLEYAAPVDSPLSERFAFKFAKLFLQIVDTKERKVDGVRFRPRKDKAYIQSNSLASDESSAIYHGFLYLFF